MAEEMRQHVEFQTERNLKAGMNPDEARYAALRQFGNVASIQEQAREARGWRWLGELVQDLRYAARTLGKAPGFTAVVVLTLALGVGLNTVVFSFYHLLTGKPLPVQAPDQVLRVSADERRFQSPFTLDEVEDLRTRLHSASAVIATSPLQVVLAGVAAGDHQLPAALQFVSENYFSGLGVPAVLGRTFAPGDETVVVVSHSVAIRVWTGSRVANLGGGFTGENRLGNTGVVVVEGSPESGWTALSWDGVPLGARP
jgi:hypothetical protein